MKLYIAVDDTFGLVHNSSTTSANVHDIVETDNLLHGEEDVVWGDAGYIGVEKRKEHAERDVGATTGKAKGNGKNKRG